MDVALDIASGLMAIVAGASLVMIVRLAPAERDALKARPPREDRPLMILMGIFSVLGIVVGSVFLYGVVVMSSGSGLLQLGLVASLLGISAVNIVRVARVRRRTAGPRSTFV